MSMMRVVLGLACLAVLQDGTAPALPKGAVARMGSGRLRNGYPLNSLAIRAQGDLMLSGGERGTVRLWRLPSGDLVKSLDGLVEDVESVAFSPDGERAAAAGADNRILVWSVSTGKVVAELLGTGTVVDRIAFSPDGRSIVTAGRDSLLRFRDAASGKELRAIRGCVTPVQAMEFSPDGTLIAAAGSDASLRLWDSATGVEVRAFPGIAHTIRALEFSRDGSKIVGGGDDSLLQIWSVPKGTELRRIKVPHERVDGVSFSPDGTMIAAGGLDCTVTLWEAATGTEKGVLQGHRRRVSALCFDPTGSILATASPDKTIRLWDVRTGKPHSFRTGHEDTVTCISVSRDSTLAVSGSEDGSVRVWELLTGKEVRSLEDPTRKGSLGVVFGRGDREIIEGDRLGTLRSWDSQTGDSLGLEFGKSPLTVWRHGETGDVVLSSSGLVARLSDARTGKEIARLEGHTDRVNCADISRDGKAVATGSDDGSLRIWDAGTGKSMATLAAGPSQPVQRAVFSPNGRFVAWFDKGTTLRISEWASGSTPVVSGSAGAAGSLTYSPDGRLLAVGGLDGIVRLCEPASGAVLLQLAGHHGEITALAFTADGAHLLSGASDGTLVTWKVRPPSSIEKPLEASELWEILESEQGERAYQALLTVESHLRDAERSRRVVEFFRKKLVSAPPLETIRSLLRQLGGDQIQGRAEAAAGLGGIGDAIEPQIEDALRNASAEEDKARLSEVLRNVRVRAAKSASVRGRLRGIWCLALLGTEDAKAALEQISTASPSAWERQEAKEARARLR